MSAFLDTNVVLAISDSNHVHYTWASQTIEEIERPLIISNIVYAELAAGVPDRKGLDQLIEDLALERMSETDEALFRAGRAFRKFRNTGTRRDSLLPDFLIGALAEMVNIPLVTINKKDFCKYFPELSLVSP